MNTLLLLLLKSLTFDDTYWTLSPSEHEHVSKHKVIGIPLPTKEMVKLGMTKTMMEDQDHLDIYGNTP
jgi:hypothetical protein